ncbi:MAG: hypothetical protein QXW97_00110 [Candidatus Pacearchaeota archaeon]
MRIIGFNLSKILGERVENIEGNLEVSQNIDIKEIKEEEIPFSKDKALKVFFSFKINYSKDFANIEFDGILIILPEKDEIKIILKDWKDKKISEDYRIPIFNFIMQKCNVKALSLEDELNLPTHFQMPRLNNAKKE